MIARTTLSGLSLGLLLSAMAFATAVAEDVNVYTYREPGLIQPLFDAFSEETGITVNVIYANKGLEERISAEGRNSPADVLISTDIGRLDHAKQLGITQAVASDILAGAIPEQFRDPDGHWFGLTTRARVVYASRDRVPENAITYAELADEKWRGRICTRSGQHAYSIGLIAALVAHDGEEATRSWLAAVRDNLAVRPTGNDRAQVKSIFAGQCDIALGNTYYMGLMLTNEREPEQKEWADAVKILFPDSAGRGTHVNVSGVVLLKNAPNRDNGIKLMEYLAGDAAQAVYASTNYEYPVKAGIAPSELVSSWGRFNADPLPLAEIAENRTAASALVDEVGFDNGPSQ